MITKEDAIFRENVKRMKFLRAFRTELVAALKFVDDEYAKARIQNDGIRGQWALENARACVSEEDR